jgi:hypothetical protein
MERRVWGQIGLAPPRASKVLPPESSLWKCWEWLRESHKGCLVSWMTSLQSWTLRAAVAHAPSTWKRMATRGTNSVWLRINSRVECPSQASLACFEEQIPTHQSSPVREEPTFISLKGEHGEPGFGHKKFLRDVHKTTTLYSNREGISCFKLFGGLVKYDFS